MRWNQGRAEIDLMLSSGELQRVPASSEQVVEAGGVRDLAGGGGTAVGRCARCDQTDDPTRGSRHGSTAAHLSF